MRLEAELPKYAHDGDSGMDVALPEEILLTPGKPLFIDLGFALEIPPGYEGQIRSRSGLTKKGLTACSGIGTIDASYRSSVGITLLWNCTPDSSWHDTWRLKRGDRVAQLVIAPVARARLVEVESLDALRTTDRKGGFGSAGIGP